MGICIEYMGKNDQLLGKANIENLDLEDVLHLQHGVGPAKDALSNLDVLAMTGREFLYKIIHMPQLFYLYGEQYVERQYQRELYDRVIARATGSNICYYVSMHETPGSQPAYTSHTYAYRSVYTLGFCAGFEDNEKEEGRPWKEEEAYIAGLMDGRDVRIFNQTLHDRPRPIIPISD